MNQIHRHVYLIYMYLLHHSTFKYFCRQLFDGNTLETTQNTKRSINHQIRKTKHHPTAKSTEIFKPTGGGRLCDIIVLGVYAFLWVILTQNLKLKHDCVICTMPN